MTVEEVKLATQIVVTVGVPLISLIGFWYSVRIRLDRIEKVLMNGGHGLVQRTEENEKHVVAIITRCEERHK